MQNGNNIYNYVYWLSCAVQLFNKTYQRGISSIHFRIQIASLSIRVITQFMMGWLERVVNQIYIVKLFLILDLLYIIRFTSTLYIVLYYILYIWLLHLSFFCSYFNTHTFLFSYSFLCSRFRPYMYGTTIERFCNWLFKAQSNTIQDCLLKAGDVVDFLV